MDLNSLIPGKSGCSFENAIFNLVLLIGIFRSSDEPSGNKSLPEPMLIGSLGTNFSEILIEILKFSFKKMHLKISSAKWWPFCLGLNVLMGFYPVVQGCPSTHSRLVCIGLWDIAWTNIDPDLSSYSVTMKQLVNFKNQILFRIWSW